MHFGERANQRQADAKPALRALQRAQALREQIENERGKFWCDAYAMVLNGHRDSIRQEAGRHFNAVVLGCELGRID